MKQAVIDVAGEVLPQAARVLADAGLQIVASFAHGLDPNEEGRIRLLVCDKAGTVLPDQCEGSGWWQVSLTFQQERYGEQVITRLHHADVIGRLVFDPAGRAKILQEAA